MVEFKHKAGDAADALADKIKKFYETYPDHPKAGEARQREKSFRQQAIALHNANASKPSEESGKPAQAQAQQETDDADPEFKKQYMEAISRVRGARQNGQPAVIAELEKSARALAKNFPKQAEPWEMLFTAAQYGTDPTNYLALFKDVAANAMDPKVREAAANEVSFRTVGKALALTYKATDGREVDLPSLKAKWSWWIFGRRGAGRALRKCQMSLRRMRNCIRRDSKLSG